MDKPIQKALSLYAAERKRFMSKCETLGVRIRNHRQTIAANIVENQKLLDEIDALQADFIEFKGKVENCNGKIEALTEFAKHL
jgi:hypothetical protein